MTQPDPLEAAGKISEEMRRISDLLTGAVTTLVGEGWTEAQAREVVVAMWVKSIRDAR